MIVFEATLAVMLGLLGLAIVFSVRRSDRKQFEENLEDVLTSNDRKRVTAWLILNPKAPKELRARVEEFRDDLDIEQDRRDLRAKFKGR